MLGAKDVDSSGGVATMLRPQKRCEEAQGLPLDKRSLLQRASAASNEKANIQSGYSPFMSVLWMMIHVDSFDTKAINH